MDFSSRTSSVASINRFPGHQVNDHVLHAALAQTKHTCGILLRGVTFALIHMHIFCYETQYFS